MQNVLAFRCPTSVIECTNAHRRWTTCRDRISDYRAGWGLLGLAPSLTSLAQQLRQLGDVHSQCAGLIM
jgi:hypothetical protein